MFAKQNRLTFTNQDCVQIHNHFQIQTMSAEGCKIAIIGSGAAGISAARYLADNSNYDITVLEADPERYGGRIWSYEGVPGYSGT